MRLLQLAVGGDVFLADVFALADPVRAVAPLFAALACREVVGHNLTAFDLPLLSRLGFAPDVPVFDTAVASRVVSAGEAAGHDLASVACRELGRELNKGQQRSDWAAPTLTPSQLAYAAADVAILVPLAALRQKRAARKVGAVLELVMKCALPVSHMAARGVGFHTNP
ncbi:dna-directed dna polymerase : DNA polymerase OS=Thermocrinis albus (strain DSM 14484 / JCM 11386 / HI 11/12) GN=Thal_1246 PE=3 SV=1: DNA_pol_A_exo1 [Gemmataceae bacterium]|nr:dna-directed dna polymerase : DNA polymerase OS=Thermocrinis albus (strain DSM 14484 / JCM 11386 / HI 11/12) GN=Thal_1246 PE=3 SV=1: DNA_pol_A_exo1 [Gemmataceae bacterium]VTU02586.1 dna-directed dna polymerase : DNA polymerase OS=Thermocrinis albus (strain DSM 14484 / JCM 11386 / HI 11/12) GN=Thal_1246 PE=3 SV=1: DNA_pol_A_exo1 [Gemmataceae bacterium]